MKEEVHAALQEAAGKAYKILLAAVKSLRNAYGGTQTALVTLPSSTVKIILSDRGKIMIGWVNCGIRVVKKPTKYFKFWHYGRFTTQCKSEVDRFSLCIKCGEGSYEAVEKGSVKNCAHVAGSSRCSAYKEALQKLTNKRR
ncbi:uncharacterized protein LOC107047030 [Diachasma alloeum]|uniref:uncharacterized protein LOC107047030 n=1 Tax=Diachasma alloeum TaxID=454923 RepID=UPI0007384BCF|nr:uncharacterized protein LOC107047030 [Diachasma alloeum]